MARILLQTTIPFAEDDWNVFRFSLLRETLEGNGHKVVARNEEIDANRSDPLMMRLPDSGFDQRWLMAVDTGDGLTQAESDAVIEFRKRGQWDLGACRLNERRALAAANVNRRADRWIERTVPLTA
jgi:hypothetical protein